MSRPRRTLVAIEYDDSGAMTARVEESPQGVPRRTRPLTWPPWDGELTDAASLVDYGRRVREALYSHPQVGKALDGLFDASAHETSSLVFDLSGALAETIRWEALQDAATAHVALRLSPRLCRIAAESSSASLSRRSFAGPLKLAAFLSAAKVSAAAEFSNLLATLKMADQHGVKIEATIYVAERDLLDMDLADYPMVERKVIPTDTLGVELELSLLKPDLLHFFCHGASETSQWLEFATVRDHLTQANGSVLFNIDRLIDCKALQNVWAVVFNCCDGGRPTPNLNSMAFRAVAQGGAPAAIGMGAPIPAGAAAIFSKAFYRGLVAQLANLKANPENQTGEIDFGEATAQGRMALHEALQDVGAACTSWSLPIVYLHRDPLLIELNAMLSKEAEIRLRTIAEQLQLLPLDAPPELRKLIWSLYEQDPVIPEPFRTDLMGKFPGRA